MLLYIQQRIFSLGDKYDVYDEQSNPVFHVRSRLFSWGAQIYIYDLLDRELYFIQQKVFSFMPQYRIFQNGQQVAVIQKRFTLFTQKLDIESNRGSLTMEGNWLGMDFAIYQNGRMLGELHKRWFTLGDCYELDIADGNDPAFFCTLTIAIDNCLHNGNNN